MRRLGSWIATTVLIATAAVMVVASPAAAAGPSGIFNYWPDNCLDQHYEGNTPTTTVYAWTDCHLEDNQLWTFEYVGGSDNYYRIKNKKGNYAWCLSNPPGFGDRVHAELCLWVQKQYWKPELVEGYNRVRNWRTQQCLTMEGIEVYVTPCSNPAPTIQRWYWF